MPDTSSKKRVKPPSKELLRLLERAEALEAYARQLREQTEVEELQPMDRDERRGALEYLVHVQGGGDPALWIRQNPELYERLAARLRVRGETAG